MTGRRRLPPRLRTSAEAERSWWIYLSVSPRRTQRETSSVVQAFIGYPPLLLDRDGRIRRRHSGRADRGDRRRVLEDRLRFARAEEARARGVHRDRRRSGQV